MKTKRRVRLKSATCQIKLAVTPSEKKSIAAAAKKNGVSIDDFIISVCVTEAAIVIAEANLGRVKERLLTEQTRWLDELDRRVGRKNT